MVAAVKKHWKEIYLPLDTTEGERPRKQVRQDLDFLDRFLATSVITTTAHNDFDAYITAPAIELGDSDAIFSWLRKSASLPNSIRQQCLDLLSIPAMSVEVERVFSAVKRTITLDRNRLQNETIEELELLKYWWYHDLIAPMA